MVRKSEMLTSPYLQAPHDPSPAKPPVTGVDWSDLRGLTYNALKALGLRAWNDPKDKSGYFKGHEGEVLMLLPHEWYNHIPDGYELFAISGERLVFELGVTSSDIRAGCLAYGILVKP